jgi:hypothetical protein
MNCLESQHLLQHRLDGDQPSDQIGLDSHLATCPECRSRYAAAQVLEQGLRQLIPPASPVGLSNRIVARVLMDQRSARRQRRGVLALAAVAAGLLTVALLDRFWPRGGGSGPGPTDESRLAKHPEPPDKRDEPQAPPVSLRESMAEAGDAVADLTLGKTGDTVRPAWSWWSELFKSPSSDGQAPAALGPPAQSLREAGNGVSAGLEPVTDSARRAFNLFLRELPSMEPEDKCGL